MSAFTELAIFCGDHPEIRAHKRIGELLQATAAELAQLKFDKDELTKSILALRGEMVLIKGMWKETIDKNTQLRAERDEARKVIEMIDGLHPDFPVITDFLKAHPEVTK